MCSEGVREEEIVSKAVRGKGDVKGGVRYIVKGKSDVWSVVWSVV